MTNCISTTFANTTNDTKIATTGFVQSVMQLLHPVGSIYINATNSTNPGTLFGFGTWLTFGAGRVLVSSNSADPLFNTAEETGGIADAVVATHTHTASTTLSSTTHTHSVSTASAGDHQHYVASNNDSDTSVISLPNDPIGYLKTPGGDSEYRLTATSGATATAGRTNVAGAHTHTMTVGNNSVTPTSATTVDSAGVTGVNQNYQPYITVYMWKRTA